MTRKDDKKVVVKKDGKKEDKFLFLYKDATKIHFPFCSYGLHKENKGRAYPYQLKRYFYEIVNSFQKKGDGNFKFIKSKRLPYWVPPSNMKSAGANKLNSTLNRKVMEANADHNLM